MQRSRRRRRIRRIVLTTSLLAALAAVGGWWYFRSAVRQLGSGPNVAVTNVDEARGASTKPPADEVKLVADEQVVGGPTSGPAAPSPAEGAAFWFEPAAADPNDLPAAQDPTATRASDETRTGNRSIEEARKLYAAGQVIEARHQLNALLKGDLSEAENAEVRALLTRIGDETIFSRRSVPGDPLVDSYVVQTGDVLLNVGKTFDVPYEILMVVNGISDPAKIRPDQKLKVLRGPFHAKIHKSSFRVDVYLQELYVRSFRVGLGTEGGTPEGLWKVKNRLSNPTYYPPASASDKRIIPPDDPNNPLGEHWIGLEGVEGGAVGHEGYGIHGTIDPASIGKAVSLGCIRMHNEDVAFFYKLMMPGRSTVTILP